MSNILLGVSGGIAAYKSAYLARLFVKDGHNVRVIMTKKAESFIGSVTFEALTGNPVLRDDYQPRSISHIEYAQWADICVIAPATANIIGKINMGIADDELTSSILALSCPLIIAPAMNCNMYNNIAVKKNIADLKENGVFIIEPDSGLLACGDIGTGKMKEPEDIAEVVYNILSGGNPEIINEEQDILKGLNILVTAGPTREYLDPVRYITNRSSGKMGYAIAETAKSMGASVRLISGDVNIKSELPDIHKAVSADDMYEAVMKFYHDADIIIMAAAVADYKPAQINDIKIKKSGETMTVELIKTKDILADMGRLKRDNQVLV
ncbi:MAG: bifunctional phosphopantothenoylcysteine decarboxylase/phosphopantothenate--cysteine ligase CoaBC, partial [Mucispirillum sp.]|nr:bifunctional phosphopantothenoylcysteine decarboxylase/phosphopantothenate--cysteine ligase CoaBC [Mucispirillum sp.]